MKERSKGRRDTLLRDVAAFGCAVLIDRAGQACRPVGRDGASVAQVASE